MNKSKPKSKHKPAIRTSEYSNPLSVYAMERGLLLFVGISEMGEKFFSPYLMCSRIFFR